MDRRQAGGRDVGCGPPLLRGAVPSPPTATQTRGMVQMTSAQQPGGGTAQIGVTGLAVMGRNLARNFARNGSPSRAQPDRRRTERWSGVRQRGRLRAGGEPRRFGGRAQAATTADDHGQGGRADRRRHQGVRAADGGGRHPHRRRQRPVRRHPTAGRGRCASAASTSSAPACPAARRAPCSARASCRAARRSPTGARPDAGDHRRQGATARRAHPHRPGRCRPLREDGAQRHRVRRHAADRGVLRPAAAGAGLGPSRSPGSSAAGTRGGWTPI